MSKRFDPKNNPNLIENPERAAQELYGYDDETLLRELKEAEMELEQMKAEDPELEAKLARETEAGFEALMQKIHTENIKPVTEREYAEKKKEEERKVTVLRPVLKVMFIAAAIMVVLSGMGIVVSARKEFEYQKVKIGNKKNEVQWNDEKHDNNAGKIEDAYEEIRNQLGIPVVAINYMPLNMTFDSIYIDKGHARMKFIYNENVIYMKETKYPVDKVSDSVSSDREEGEFVFNPWLEKELKIEANKLDENITEYSTSFELQGAYYYLSGIMEKDLFEKMIKSLYYY